MNSHFWRRLAAACLFVFLPSLMWGLGEVRVIDREPVAGGFPLLSGGVVPTVYADAAEWAGVRRAANDFARDLQSVGGVLPTVVGAAPQGELAVVVGTIGRSTWVDTLEASGKIDLGSVRGKWESHLVQVVEKPWPGLERALVIVGSDKRGSIYGLYGLSEQIGVSPWQWWADVPARRADALWVKPGRHLEGEPAVQYRGIFLNDEAPALTGWATEKFGGLNRHFYTRVFELLLRLRANYLWPAMWNNAFNEDDPLNPQLADEYGIVMGTSHHEPMLRSQQEWHRHGRGPWDYHHNEAGLAEFWSAGVKRNRAYESIVTLGMRGDGDEPMSESENVALLEKIVADQREILRREVNPDVEKIPQLWALYKEVQTYYERGMRVPDDVILLWCDDNWGNLRRLPTPEEENRKGGAGVYYHFDYVGGPRSYKWLNTNSLPKIWQQMEQANARKANRIWIVNVGDLKLMEFPTEFFLTLARAPQAWPYERLGEYTRSWAEREFGAAHADAIKALMDGYTRINAMRKPELLSPTTWSLIHYEEADRMVAEVETLMAQARTLREALPVEARDAFFQLVQFPLEASGQVLALHVAAARTHLYGLQGRRSTNLWAEEAHRLFAADEALTKTFHTEVAQGKWNHIAAQTHLGYTYWQQPPRNVMPPVQRIQVPVGLDWGFTFEGTAGSWPTDNIHQGPPVLPAFERSGPALRWVELFARSAGNPRVRLSTEQAWIKLETAECILTADTKVAISVDWEKAPAGRAEGVIRLQGEGREYRIKVPSVNEIPVGPPGGAIETGGVVVLEAGDYQRAAPPPGGEWKVLSGLGRHREGLTTYPSRLARSETRGAGAWVEYDFYVKKEGDVTLRLVFEPGLDHQPGRAHFGLSLGEPTPDILPAFPRPGPEWDKAVADAAHVVTVKRTLARAGWHTLRYWRVDAGVVLLRIEVDTGGWRPSYLGPPSSPRLPR